MSLLTLLLLTGALSIVVGCLLPAVRRPDAVVRVPGPVDVSPELAAAWRGARARTWLLYCSAPLAIGLTLWLATVVDGFNGLGAALAPLGMAALVCVVAAWPRRRVAGEGAVRTAGLEARPTARFGARWVLALPLSVLGTLVLLLILTGIGSARDQSDGRWRSLAYTSRSGIEWNADGTVVMGIQAGTGAAGPYPGWYYGLPIIVAAAIVAALLVLALRSNALAPAWQGSGATSLDAPARAAVARTASLLVSVCALITLGGVAAMAGSAWHSAAWETALTVGQTVATPFDSPGRLDPWRLGVAIAFVALGLASMFIATLLGGVLGATLRVFRAPVTSHGRRVTGPWPAQEPVAVADPAGGAAAS